MNSRLRSVRFFLGLFLLSVGWLGVPLVHAELRTFTSNDGVTKKGELVSVNGDQVTIKWADGTTTTAPTAGFCGADNAYFKEHASAPTPAPASSKAPAPAADAGVLPADAVVVQAYIDGHTELRVKKGGIYWLSSGRAAKPGMGGKQNLPTYVGTVAWMPVWANGNAKGRDKSDVHPVSITDPRNLDFKLLTVGPEKDSVGIEPRDEIKVSTNADEFSVYIPDRQRGARWYKFALIPKKESSK